MSEWLMQTASCWKQQGGLWEVAIGPDEASILRPNGDPHCNPTLCHQSITPVAWRRLISTMKAHLGRPSAHWCCLWVTATYIYTWAYHSLLQSVFQSKGTKVYPILSCFYLTNNEWFNGGLTLESRMTVYPCIVRCLARARPHPTYLGPHCNSLFIHWCSVASEVFLSEQPIACTKQDICSICSLFVHLTTCIIS